jgi:glycerophosphoryl diester phosphodiesterase
MTGSLPPAFLARPIAHRALHGPGRPENSLAAVRAAVEAGYGIEIDVQLTQDGEALVFHDEDLARLTGARGLVRERRLRDMATIRLSGSDTGETPPPLKAVLAAVAGRVPLLIEIKDQDGALGEDVGELEAAVARALEGYSGPVAVMSFNPHSVAAMQALAPDVPRGLTTDPFEAEDWPVAEDRRRHLAAIADYERVGACFISHNHRDLARPRVAELRKGGAAVLCWTIRSPQEEAAARRYADNVTFEGYLPDAGA